jgi:hypothetical protein
MLSNLRGEVGSRVADPRKLGQPLRDALHTAGCAAVRFGDVEGALALGVASSEHPRPELDTAGIGQLTLCRDRSGVAEQVPGADEYVDDCVSFR